jgi:hypothetical protein
MEYLPGTKLQFSKRFTRIPICRSVLSAFFRFSLTTALICSARFRVTLE